MARMVAAEVQSDRVLHVAPREIDLLVEAPRIGLLFAERGDDEARVGFALRPFRLGYDPPLDASGCRGLFVGSLSRSLSTSICGRRGGRRARPCATCRDLLQLLRRNQSDRRAVSITQLPEKLRISEIQMAPGFALQL
jgi:hypothetical protein